MLVVAKHTGVVEEIQETLNEEAATDRVSVTHALLLMQPEMINLETNAVLPWYSNVRLLAFPTQNVTQHSTTKTYINESEFPNKNLAGSKKRTRLFTLV